MTERVPAMRQYAPGPLELEDLVKRIRYRPGWRATLTDMERDPADTHGNPAGVDLAITPSSRPSPGRAHHRRVRPRPTGLRALRRWRLRPSPPQEQVTT